MRTDLLSLRGLKISQVFVSKISKTLLKNLICVEELLQLTKLASFFNSASVKPQIFGKYHESIPMQESYHYFPGELPSFPREYYAPLIVID